MIHSLSFKVIVALLVAAVVPVIAVQWYGMREFERTLLREAVLSVRDVADRKAERLNEHVRDNIRAVEDFALRPATSRELRQVAAAFAKGMASESYRKAGDALHARYAALAMRHGFWDVLLVSREGDVVFTVAREPDLGQNVYTGSLGETELARAVRLARDTLEVGFAGGGDYAPSGKPAAFYAAPVLGEGRLAGFLVVQVDVDLFGSVASDSAGLGRSARALVARLGADGVPVLPSEILAAELPPSAPAGQLALAPIRLALAGERGEGEILDTRGVPVVAAWRFVPEARLGMVVKVDRDEALAPAAAMRTRLWVALAIIGGFVVLFGIPLGRRLTLPLRQLNAMMKDLAQGRAASPFRRRARDEITELADAFGRMAGDVRSRTAALEASERRARAIHESISDALLLLGDAPGWPVVEANPASVRLFRADSAQALVGCTLEQLSADRQLDGNAARVAVAGAVGSAIAGERPAIRWIHRRPDGSTFPAELALARIDVGGGSLVLAAIRDLTDVLAAQENALDAQLLTEQVLDAVPIPILLTATGTGQFLRVNRAFREFHGLDWNAIAGRSSHDFYVDDDRDRVVGDLRARGVSEACVQRMGSGERRRILLHGKFIPYEGQEAILAAWIDVTDARLGEERLRESEERFRRLTALSSDWYWEQDESLRFTVVTAPSSSASQAPVGTLGRCRWDIPGVQPLAGSWREHRALVEAHQPFRDFAYAWRDREGRTRYTATSGEPVFDGQGRFLGYRGVATDITEKEEAFRALRESERKLQMTFDFMQDGFIRLARDGGIAAANRAMADMLGYPSVEALLAVTSFVLFVEPADRLKIAERLASEGRITGYRCALRRRDGGVVWTEIGAHRVQDAAGRPAGDEGVVRDITARVREEEALHEAKAAAEAATRARSEFLANMSHEIRTPLNAIIGLAHLALRTELDAKQRDYVRKVHNAGTSLLGVINDILDFSKIEAGKLDVESIEFVLDDVLGDLAAMMGQRVFDKGLEFVYAVNPDVPQRLVGDPGRLRQVLTNLVGNAAKFTERGDIAVRIELLERAGERLKLGFEVADTGIGMSRAQMSRLFQAFTQADASTTRKYGGTGLGLAICKRLVELMGGTIGADSAEGRGSTFHFTAWFGASRQPGALAIPAALTGTRVLVVDDSATARMVLAKRLGQLPVAVEEADGGEAAVEAVRSAGERPYGLVLMDWDMPGLDGIEAARRIAALPGVRPPRIVLVSAYGAEDWQEKARGVRLDAVLLKPVGATQLTDTLFRLFAPPSATPAPEHEGREPKEWGLQGLRVMLVEDVEVNQQVAVELLRSAGVTVEVAGNGAEALDLLREGRPFDAVLMDIQMPVMDGLTATRHIRANAAWQAMPILAMTAHAMADERERCLAAGMQDHITKPVDPDRLYRALAQWTRRGESAGTATGGAANGARRTEPPAGLPDLPGFDVAGGLRRSGGKREVYLRLLRRAAETQADSGARIRAAIAQGDREAARREAHSMKGAASTLGATVLAEASAALEEGIKAGAETPAQLAAFEEALAAAVAAIRSATA